MKNSSSRVVREVRKHPRGKTPYSGSESDHPISSTDDSFNDPDYEDTLEVLDSSFEKDPEESNILEILKRSRPKLHQKSDLVHKAVANMEMNRKCGLDKLGKQSEKVKVEEMTQDRKRRRKKHSTGDRDTKASTTLKVAATKENEAKKSVRKVENNRKPEKARKEAEEAIAADGGDKTKAAKKTEIIKQGLLDEYGKPSENARMHSSNAKAGGVMVEEVKTDRKKKRQHRGGDRDTTAKKAKEEPEETAAAGDTTLEVGSSANN